MGRRSNSWRGTRTRSTLLAFLACAISALYADTPPPAASQADASALKKLSLEQLSQIEVTTPSKEPEKAFDTPSAVFVITGEDIRRSGATNIPEALRLAPGVEVARIDGNHWSIGIRGFGTRLNRSVLVLMDGRTVYTSLFDGTYWEVQDTLLEDVDRIEVIRGPGGTVWGPNAVNGVINIITKSTQDTRGTFVSAGGGETDTQGFLNVRYGGGNGKGFDYRLYGKTFTDGPEDHSDNRNFDDWRAVQAGFRLDWTDKDWTDTSRGTFTLQGDIYDEEAGEAVQVNNYVKPYSQIVDSNALLSGGNVMGRWQRTISDSDDIQVQAYYDRTNRYESNLKDLRNTFDVDFLQRLSLPGLQKVTWGLGARVVPVSDFGVASGLTFVPDSRTDYLLTGFLQDEVTLIERRLTLTVGTKVLQTNFLHGIGLEPSARLTWTLDEKQTVWGAFTHTLRTPSDVEENFYLSSFQGNLPNGTPLFARFDANSRFSPEQMNGYELGYRRLLGKHFLVDTAAFYNHYHDLFDEEFAGPIFSESSEPGVSTPAPAHYLLPAQFGNGLLAYTKGIEVSPEWRPASFWRLRGSYSYLHMTVYNAPGSPNIEPPASITGSSPAHQLTIQSQLDVAKKIHLDLTYRYVSALPAQQVPAYSTADARIAWQLNGQLEFSLVGTNLLQPSHFEDGGDPDALGNVLLVGIERSGYAQIAWRR